MKNNKFINHNYLKKKIIEINLYKQIIDYNSMQEFRKYKNNFNNRVRNLNINILIYQTV